jgi:pyridinium-3,5-biscarboxylic acid mononucleotide sulfurtransferase
VRQFLNPSTVRCRIRASGVVVELDAATLGALGAEQRALVETEVGEIFRSGGIEHTVKVAPYQVGSAFLHKVSFRPRV